jgi:cytidine deaminase
MDEFDDLLKAARDCREQAYAPYSRFKVGAALRAASGAIYVGCNVENAAYPVGLCAEAVAIGAMAAAGERRISDILIVGGDGGAPVAPCGACRQRILEFAEPDARVAVADEAGVRAAYKFADLLPHAFSAQTLGRTDPEAADE